MSAYLRLLLVLSARRVTGRVALLSAALLPGALAAIGRLSRVRAPPPPPSLEAHASAFFVAALVTLAFASLLTGSAMADERLERRIPVLRVAGVDGARAMLPVMLHAACVAGLLGALATVSAAVGAAWFDARALGPFAVIIVLIGTALGSLGVLATAVLGRPAWTVLGMGISALAAFSVLAGLTEEPARPAAAVALAAFAAVACAGLLFSAPSLARVLPGLQLRMWE